MMQLARMMLAVPTESGGDPNNDWWEVAIGVGGMVITLSLAITVFVIRWRAGDHNITRRRARDIKKEAG